MIKEKRKKCKGILFLDTKNIFKIEKVVVKGPISIIKASEMAVFFSIPHIFGLET